MINLFKLKLFNLLILIISRFYSINAFNPTYIIHKLTDGTYLKWKTYPFEVVD